MADRRFPQKLIPPGINDERTRALLTLVEAMANEEFDFTHLLMRNAEEMVSSVLPLAVHERSLAEFLDVNGSPEPAVRNLIDQAFALHETQGTDRGLLDALDAFGVPADILQWFELEPEGPPHTHTITAEAQDIYGDGDIWATRVNRQIWRVVDAMKRWSQETSLRLAATNTTPAFMAVFPSTRMTVTAHPFLLDPPIASGVQRAGVVPLTRLFVTAEAA